VRYRVPILSGSDNSAIPVLSVLRIPLMKGVSKVCIVGAVSYDGCASPYPPMYNTTLARLLRIRRISLASPRSMGPNILPNLTRFFAASSAKPSPTAVSSSDQAMSNTNAPQPGSLNKPDAEWRAVLSPEQFRVLREKGTESAGTGEYEHNKADGVYACAGCGTPLYTSTHKFSSGCGWPAFFDAIPGAVSRHTDRSWGMSRTEITCTACGGHLGHVFKGEGFKTPIDERHCVNSVSLKFHDETSKPMEAPQSDETKA